MHSLVQVIIFVNYFNRVMKEFTLHFKHYYCSFALKNFRDIYYAKYYGQGRREMAAGEKNLK